MIESNPLSDNVFLTVSSVIDYCLLQIGATKCSRLTLQKYVMIHYILQYRVGLHCQIIAEPYKNRFTAWTPLITVITDLQRIITTQ